MRRVIAHVAASTSTTSLALLHATYTFFPSALGCAHVGEQETVRAAGAAPAGGGTLPCAACPPAAPAAAGAPAIPCSLPLPSRKWRLTSSVRVSISTSASSIMHAE